MDTQIKVSVTLDGYQPVTDYVVSFTATAGEVVAIGKLLADEGRQRVRRLELAAVVVAAGLPEGFAADRPRHQLP